MFIKTEENGFVLPAVTEYLSMQSIISNCCSTTSNHNLFPGSVCCPLVPLQECSWGCNSEMTWSVLKNNLREIRKLGIWASQDSFWGIHWECQDKYCIIITGYCPPVLGIYTVRLVSAVTPLGNPKGNVQNWDFPATCFCVCGREGLKKFDRVGYGSFFLLLLEGNFTFIPCPFSRNNFLLPGTCWGLKGRCAWGPAPQTMWNYWEQTAKWRIRDISGNCTKPRSYIFPQFPRLLWILCLNFMWQFGCYLLSN